ncbi:MAG TPA: fasciclin domain-containing protein [Candidatus Saccharimonadales bacterium]|nr:fasciclin domain-containing protein [Candidatus Saccharimonadales bacterium]
MKKLLLFTTLTILLLLGAPFSSVKVSAASVNPVNVYRFYSRRFSNAHFYTTSTPEAANLIAKDPNWWYEGIDFGAYENDSNGCQSHTAVYRFWSSNFKSHFFTISAAERDQLIAGNHDWWYEGVAYCADSAQVANTYPLYRFWSPNYHKHFYTAAEVEKNYLIATNPNWRYEGVAYYVPKGKDCLPPDATSYDKTFTGMTNSSYLTTNSYGDTKQFYDGLNFAGLLPIVDSPQTVVFAPNDYVWDNYLTSAQKTFMNQSPENMRSVLGWHIITGCVIYHHQMDEVNYTMTLTTLNGTVTYTPQDIGALDNVDVAIWDWFTSNGAVHFITGFIRPPS